MKRVLALLFILSTGSVFGENVILAVVNNSVITSNLLEASLFNLKSKESKVDFINQRINNILQLQKAKEFNIEASLNDVNLALLEISKSNNTSLEQLQAYPEFLSLKTEVSEKISILNLQRYITKDVTIDENEAINVCSKKTSGKIKQIKIAQIIISEIEAEMQIDKDIAIKSFLNKLSKHISKGASFENFAKLHSQHSSYAKGGITDWIEVNNATVKMLDSLKNNEVSQIYMNNFGFAIGIKLDERFVSSNIKQCKEKLIFLKAEKFYSNWVNGLQEEAFIKIYHDAL
ncbi:peptidylprolyl isomerase [Candidatus Pseudothioglobus sp. Uisw_041]|jgi:peptidyl-prolyl cis-trans isomerase SurA|uniref:peptidylprolyl isomerase n=1 Tax=Candidatus Pseudothioglobus sp. Uisw_041 TaxID=3230996 RepID=UPI003A85EDF8